MSNLVKSSKNNKTLHQKVKQKKRAYSKDKIFNLVDFIFIPLFICVVVLGFVFASNIDLKINKIDKDVVNKITINNAVKAHFLDVDQATCVLVELPDDKLIVYDTGFEENGIYISKFINKTLKRDSIDLLILSHTDSDHIGGAPYLLDNFKVLNIVRPITKSSNEIYNEAEENLDNKYTVLNDSLYATVLQKIYAENCNVYESDYKNIEHLNSVFDTKCCNLQFYIPQFYKSSNSNDFSCCLTITYMGQTLMLTGDLTQRSEQNLLDNYSLPDVNFLLIAHHGSKDGSSLKFLQKVLPEYAYISAGKDNSYNHPSYDTLNKLNFLNISQERIYITSESGNILLAFNGAKIQNYIDKINIKTAYILIGIILVVIMLYLPKITKLLKNFIANLIKKCKKNKVLQSKTKI